MSPEVAAWSWSTALIFLASGLAGGGILAWILRRRAASGPRGEDAALPVEVRDLAHKEATLLAQLEELDDTAGKYLPAERARLRGDLELEAAVTLQAYEASLLEARRRRAHPPAARAGQAPARRRPRALSAASCGGRAPWRPSPCCCFSCPSRRRRASRRGA